MPEYNAPVDIGNRALQHVGSELMDTTLGFSEQSKRAQEVSNCYGKVRRAELQRNIWTFCTRRAAVRPIGSPSDTMLLAPTLWSSTVTYFVGSVVADAFGTLWQSKIRNNLNNQPGQNFAAWEPYFGPMTVHLYDSSTACFSGEITFTAAGDGTVNIFRSLFDGNAVHPALPNQWSVSTAYLKDNVVQRFPNWAIGTTYAQGQGALYTDGNVYVSLTNGNVGNAPPSSASWIIMPTLQLFTPIVPANLSQPATSPSTSPILEWQQGQAYAIGSFAVFNAAVWLSISNSNTGVFPNASGQTAWVQVSGGALYQSLTDINLGNDPASAPVLWAIGTTYAANALVGGSDGLIYKSLQNGNVGNNPANGASPTFWQALGLLPWTTVFTSGGGNSLWMQIGGAAFPSGVGLNGLNLTYPVGTGPAWQTTTRNVYRLPAGFLKRAPEDPKSGAFSWLGAPGNDAADDWTFEGKYLVTVESTPIVLRFVADVQDVTSFDDLFCEGLACRIAWEVCEPLTQSTSKQGMIAQSYKKFMGDARMSNAIEAGPTDPPLDDWIACRA